MSRVLPDRSWLGVEQSVSRVVEVDLICRGQGVIQGLQDGLQLAVGDDQRRSDEQRGLLAAGGDHHPGVERGARPGRPAGSVVAASQLPPVAAVQLDRPVQAAAVDPLDPGMGVGELLDPRRAAGRSVGALTRPSRAKTRTWP